MTTDTARLIIVASVVATSRPAATTLGGAPKRRARQTASRCVHCADGDGIDVVDADLERRVGERDRQRKADVAAAADDTDVQALRHRADMLPAARRAPLDLRRPP